MFDGKTLNRPIAVIWYLEPQYTGGVAQWIDEWKSSSLTDNFVCIMAASRNRSIIALTCDGSVSLVGIGGRRGGANVVTSIK